MPDLENPAKNPASVDRCLPTCSRLRRLARCYLLRYDTAGPDAWDAPRGEAWTYAK